MQSQHHGPSAAAPVRLAATLLLATAIPAFAQKPADINPCPFPRTACADYRETHSITKTFYLPNITQQNDANEVLVAIRNLLDPGIKVYLVASQNTIVIRALPEDLAAAQRLIDDLTHPRKTFDLAFTLITVEDGKTLPPETVHLSATVGQRTTMKQGSKIPVAVTHPADKTADAAMTYLDIGVNIDVTLADSAPGLSMRAKIERSFLDESKPPAFALHATIGQSILEETTSFPIGKSRRIGSITEPHHSVTIEVLATPIN